MTWGDRRLRFVAVIPLVIGIAIIFAGSFAKEFGTPLPFPSDAVGGGVIGIGVALFMMSRAAPKDEEPPPN